MTPAHDPAPGGRVREGFVRVGGVPLHIRVEGVGPVCVLSAGLGLAWFDWDAVVPLLAPHRTVVRFDRPGHGLSASAAPAGAVGEAHRIAGLLDALGPALPPGPVTVVGHSLAGLHAEAFARLYPARTAALVLVDSSVEERRPYAPAPALRTAGARVLGGALTAAGLPAALGPLARRAVVRAGRTGGPDPARGSSYAAATGPGGSGGAPSARTPATPTPPPGFSRCDAAAVRCGRRSACSRRTTGPGGGARCGGWRGRRRSPRRWARALRWLRRRVTCSCWTARTAWHERYSPRPDRPRARATPARRPAVTRASSLGGWP